MPEFSLFSWKVGLNVSRRLADLRFRELTDKSILEHILDIRLAEVCRQLAKTDNRIADIASSCHCDAAGLKNLFRRHFGMSMRDWRKRANSSGSRPKCDGANT